MGLGYIMVVFLLAFWEASVKPGLWTMDHGLGRWTRPMNWTIGPRICVCTCANCLLTIEIGSKGYSTWSVCLSGVCITTLSATTRNKPAKSDTNGFGATLVWFDFTFVDFRKTTLFESYGAKTESTSQLAQAYLDRVRSLFVSWRHKKSQRRASIDSCMLSSSVASPCQTLREQLAGDHE